MRALYRIKQSILLLGDLISFAVGFWLALLLRNLSLPSVEMLARHVSLFAITFFIWLVINYINGLYDLSQQSQKKKYRRISETALFSLIVSVIFFYLVPDQTIAPKTILLLAVVFGYGLSAIWRTIYAKIIEGGKLHIGVLCIGYTPELKELISILQDNPEKGYRVIGVVDPEQECDESLPPSIYLTHSTAEVEDLIRDHDIKLVVTAPHLREDKQTLELLYKLLFTDVHVTDLTMFYQMITGRIPPATFSQGWFLDHLRKQDHPVYLRSKRAFDYVMSIAIGLLFVASLPIIGVLIKLTSKGPVFIKQTRIGKDGKTFTLYKYRSMLALSKDGSAEPDGVQFAKKDDNRITPFGKLLRLTRLDELPQVINLLRGDMTFIGPRPERPEIVEELTRQMVYYPLRHIVKPGLTGWAVLHQDYTDTLEKSLQKLQYDLYYIKNQSFLLDISILLKTINKIVRMKGQ